MKVRFGGGAGLQENNVFIRHIQRKRAARVQDIHLLAGQAVNIPAPAFPERRLRAVRGIERRVHGDNARQDVQRGFNAGVVHVAMFLWLKFSQTGEVCFDGLL